MSSTPGSFRTGAESLPRAARYRLVPLTPLEISRWEELIAPFGEGELFHQRPWLDYLAASRGLAIRFWRILEGSTAVGYFCGALLRKGPFRVLGSPLKGWGTNFMGPIGEAGIDEAAFLQALDELARQEDLAMIELEYRGSNDSALEASGFVPVRDKTYVVTLSPNDPDRMWSSLEPTCRNRIRKATKNGLTVEEARDPEIADEFYDQLLPIMLRQGVAPPYPRTYVHELVRHLMNEDRLFALRVKDAAGRNIASGLFPHDRKTMYFWGGASLLEARKVCPNELMHWTAMRLAAAGGLREYNMCGPGAFKKKFGGSLVQTTRWHKSYRPYAEPARRMYQTYFKARMRIQAWLLRTLSLRTPSTEHAPSG